MQDLAGCDFLCAVVGDEVLENHLGQRHVHGLAVQAGEGRDADEGAFEFADVAGDLGSDVLQCVVRGGEAFAEGLLPEDGDAGFQFRRLDVRQQAPLEAGLHPVLESCQQLGRLVRGDDHLLVVVVQGVERVEELLQRPVLAGQELDVVDQQDVDVAVRGLEAGAFIVADGVDEVVGEFLGVDVPDADAAVEPAGVVADGVQQVGLAESRSRRR